MRTVPVMSLAKAAVVAALAFVVMIAAGCGGETNKSGGAAGTAPSGGGGAGGSGAAGSSSGGSAGGPSCDSSCNACKSCALDGACKDELTACTSSAACAAIDACVSDCEPLSTDCVGKCAAAQPLGASSFFALTSCLLCDSCATACQGCDSLSCVNGVQDGAEAGVDCGGPCAPCGDGKPCSTGADCVSGNCVEGLCCDSACGGPCEACSAAKTGVLDGACRPVPNNADPDSECATGDACNGAGACRCDDGMINGSETGMDCGGPVCGLCPQGQPCNSAADCATGACADGVCCDSNCKGACNACSAAKKGGGADGVCGPIGAGLDPDDECTSPAADACNGSSACQCFDGVKNGGETGVDCGGPVCLVCGGTCMNSVQDGGESDVDCGGANCPKCVAGKKCTAGPDCGSGNCVDGVCCNGDCGGTCSACVMAKTGQPNGTCAPIPNGQDPDGECLDQGAGSCGSDGVCGGAGACRFYPQGSPCNDAQSCVGTTQSNADSCNGAGVCLEGATISCVPYVCGQGACKSMCAGDADCSAGNYCAAPSCVPKKVNGQACAAANQCQSGSCTDGVCCNAACGGTCNACVMAKTGQPNGSCAPIPSGQDPDNECADQGAASCATNGSCSGAGACALYPSGTPCNTTCAAQVQTNFTCNGGGACLGSSTTPCGNYLCANMSVCGASCVSDAQCITPAYCNVASCLPDKPNGQTCASAAQCQSGNCVLGVCCDQPSCGANATCGGGSCNCNGSFQNCNGSWGDGCESNGDSDNGNCGGCGNSCPGARYECCGGTCKDLCNPQACGDCFGCPGMQCFGNTCGQACP